MKVEWLDERLSRAIVTRGWLRKRQAHVRYDGFYWCFAATVRYVSLWVDWRLNVARAKEFRRRGEEWQVVRALPEAKVLR